MATGIESIAKTLLSSDALKGIAKATGASKDDVTSVLTNALPTLLAGANKQTTGAKTAQGFIDALSSHAKTSTTDLTSFFKNVDIEDGSKIVGHLLGKTSDKTAAKAAKNTGVDAAQAAKILAAAAPLLMSLLGKKTKTASKKDKETNIVDIASSLLKSSDVTSLLKGFLK